MANATPCVFIFKHAVCPIDSNEEDWINEYPRVRGYLSPSFYVQTLLCEESLKGWQVESSVLPGGGSWVGYRKGVDSIWTGVGTYQRQCHSYRNSGNHSDNHGDSHGGSDRSSGSGSVRDSVRIGSFLFLYLCLNERRADATASIENYLS